MASNCGYLFHVHRRSKCRLHGISSWISATLTAKCGWGGSLYVRFVAHEPSRRPGAFQYKRNYVPIGSRRVFGPGLDHMNTQTNTSAYAGGGAQVPVLPDAADRFRRGRAGSPMRTGRGLPLPAMTGGPARASVYGMSAIDPAATSATRCSSRRWAGGPAARWCGGKPVACCWCIDAADHGHVGGTIPGCRRNEGNPRSGLLVLLDSRGLGAGRAVVVRRPLSTGRVSLCDVAAAGIDIAGLEVCLPAGSGVACLLLPRSRRPWWRRERHQVLAAVNDLGHRQLRTGPSSHPLRGSVGSADVTSQVEDGPSEERYRHGLRPSAPASAQLQGPATPRHPTRGSFCGLRLDRKCRPATASRPPRMRNSRLCKCRLWWLDSPASGPPQGSIHRLRPA
jgi:hypothetical protein